MVDTSKEAAIRARAYQLWEESGRADGSQDAHWRQAEREIAERDEPDREGSSEAEDASPPVQPRAPGPVGRHSDGMSRHPSVIDPGPRR